MNAAGRAVIAAVAMVMAAASGPLQSATAATPPALVATGFLAVTTASGSAQVSRFKLDGTGEQKLTTGPIQHYGAAVSPDGKQVLFQGEEGGAYGLYRMNIDGTGTSPITKPPVMAGRGDWSPDGRSIVYPAQSGKGKYQIYVAQPDGGNPVQLTRTTDGSQNGAPAFSPDGASIAYTNTLIDTAGGGAIPKTKIWVMTAKDGSGAKAVSAGDGDNYPAWLDADTILFARTGNAGKSSAILSVTLSGVEKPQSPAEEWLTEPRPLPDHKSYGATHLKGSNLEVVQVSRTDKAPLVAGRSDLVLVDFTSGIWSIRTFANILGDYYSVVYILALGSPAGAAAKAPPGAKASAPVAPPVPIAWIGLGVLVLLVLGGGAAVVKGRRPAPPPLPKLTPTTPGGPPLPPGGEITKQPAPSPVAVADVSCGYREGWDIMLKYEHRVKFGFLGFSKEQAARQAVQHLRNRLTVEEPQIREWLKSWSDGIGCRPPCVKHVVWEEKEAPFWEEPHESDSDSSMVAYMRMSFGVTVECRVRTADDPPPS